MSITKVIIVLAVLSGLLPAAYAQEDAAYRNVQTNSMSPAEQSAAAELFQDANDARAAAGVPQLHDDPALTQAAWFHAQRIVQANALSHQFPGEPNLIVRVQQAGVHCSTVAENIAAGPNAARIHDEWIHSTSHRENLLDPRVNTVGIAVVKRGGAIFAVQDFARETDALTPSQQEQRVASQLTAQGLQMERDSSAARGRCNGTPNRQGTLPKLVVRYSTTDLSHLPQQVQQGIAAGDYHRAAVGACRASVQNGFNAYQIVILLY